MPISRTWGRVAMGAALAAGIAAALPAPKAAARAGGKKKGGVMRLLDVDVGEDFAGVYQNQIISMKFSLPVDPSTVKPATFQFRVENSTGTGFPIDVPGSFQVAGSIVRFYPRLPTHLKDPNDPAGGYYQPNTKFDDANANAGFQPNKNHQIKIVASGVRSVTGRVLNRDYTDRFTTSPETPKTDAFTIDSYDDAPPPGFEFSNPPDKVASAADQYARHGGTTGVPSDISVTLFGNKVPLSPNTVRQSGNVTLTMLSRRDDPAFRKLMAGTTYIEQNFDTVKLVFEPKFPLPDLGTFAMKISKNVKDLTEIYDFKNNAERLRLRQIYEFMVAARQLNPTVPPSQLQNPPDELIRDDWPADAATRGILKTNVLLLGDTYPDEVDPRVMVLFSTQDEPITHGSVVLNFQTVEGLFDPTRSTAEWDQSVPGAASAVFTFAGGSAVNGDFTPAVGSQTTISIDTYPQNTVNWRKVDVPAGATLRLVGTRPAVLKALNFSFAGTIIADGNVGNTLPTAFQNTYQYNIPLAQCSRQLGATPSLGSGKGGDSSIIDLVGQPGGTGASGSDPLGVVANPIDGGQGGLGGLQPATSPNYPNSGAGGGGGARLAGTAGQSVSYNPLYSTTTSSWPLAPSGSGGSGAGGNDDLSPLVGGAGGGAGGSSVWLTPTPYIRTAGAGGSGGGAVLIQAASTLHLASTASLRARGGAGGNGASGSYSYFTAGPGGGGGGGSFLLRSSKGFSFGAAPGSNFDVAGGAGGTNVVYATYMLAASTGGNGGTGFIRIEDPKGGVSIPGATAGSFNPVGAGVPSYVYSKWIGIGVDAPKLRNFSENDFVLEAENDALFIEMQAAIEDPAKLDFPLLRALDASENSTNINEVSQWMPVRLIDATFDGGAITVPGNTSTDVVFPIEPKVAGKNYKHVRYRITFQLDPTQTAGSPVPFVDQITLNFDFNY